ncbi:MAG: hypothetical protein KatS3mg057_0247 [Herpetosiphonaceae bacterium]|nr:MAG: hypothetical protein KatS3mg057_0247 [Herpetosiphonaceae bacterium]
MVPSDSAQAPPRHPLVLLARQAVETYVRFGRIIDVPQPLPPELSQPGAVFVCLKIGGVLRGCVGTIEPRSLSIAHETIANAIAAAVNDPRFFPVSVAELPSLTYTIDLLHPPEPVNSIEELDPVRFGVIVSSGARRGLLLPALEGIADAAMQVLLAAQKAGIRPGEPVTLQRFAVERLT